MNTTKWQDLSDEVRETWCERATEWLVERCWLPLSDDVWATDKYADRIESKAEEMYEDDQADRLASLAE
jgi:hypothetical protein